MVLVTASAKDILFDQDFVYQCRGQLINWSTSWALRRGIDFVVLDFSYYLFMIKFIENLNMCLLFLVLHGGMLSQVQNR